MGPLAMQEMVSAENLRIKKVQWSTLQNLQAPGWDLVKDDRNILRCSGRILGYNPTYIEEGLFGERLIAHVQRADNAPGSCKHYGKCMK